MVDVAVGLVDDNARIAVGAAKRAEAARDIVIASARVVTGTTSTGNAIVASSNGLALTAYPANLTVEVKLPGNYVQPPQDTIPTLKVDNGPAWGIYDGLNAAPDATLLRPGATLTLRASSSFGGLWQLVGVSPLSAKDVVWLTRSSGADAPNTIVASGDGRPWSRDKIYLLQLGADVTATVPTLARDGLPALGIYDSSANLLPEGYLRLGRSYPLIWAPDFGGVLKVLGAERPRSTADYSRGIVGAHEAKAGVRQLYRELHPVPGAFAAPLYENLFTSQGKCNEVEIAHGGLDSQTTPSYDKLVYNAAGYGVMDCDVGGGLWSDHNHIWPGPGMLNLLGVFKTVAAGGVIPNLSDIRNLRVTMELRAQNLFLPPEARLALHMQMTDDASAGTGGPVNYVYAERMIDEALGYGYSNAGGLGWPHLRTTPRSSGWVTFTADFAPNDAFFQCIGSSESRKDTYRVAPVERAMRGTFLDWIIVALHPQQDGPTSMPLQRLSGQLQIRRFAVQAAV